jgi:hypothetical protein
VHCRVSLGFGQHARGVIVCGAWCQRLVVSPALGSHTEVAQDVYKLSMLLDEMERRELVGPQPLAYFCLLDNRAGHQYNRQWLTKRLTTVAAHEGVKILYWPPA